MSVVGRVAIHQLALGTRGYMEIEDEALVEKLVWLTHVAKRPDAERIQETAQRFFEAYLDGNDRLCDAYGLALLELHPRPFTLVVSFGLEAAVIAEP